VTIVDTHAHVYSEDEQKYPKIEKPLRPPAGKGTLEHLQEEVQKNGVHRVVAVQTSSAYRWDNRLTADVVKTNRAWMTGVCTLNPEDPASPGLLRRYRAECGIRGLRVFPTPGQDPGLGHEGHIRLWETAAEIGVVICALIQADACDALARLLERYPNVPTVLDHCANLKASDVPDSEALRAVLSLARFPNLTAKLTMLITGSEQEVPCRDMHGIARRILDAFGPDRCIWGSDFPCELWIPKATYAQHLHIFTDEMGLSTPEQEAILGKTAMRLWFE
jgi:predicted TIM-barrel fold metal-dependent hydrolase